MRKDNDPAAESSADALLTQKTVKKSEKVHISYDKTGKMNKNDNFEKALIHLKTKNEGFLLH